LLNINIEEGIDFSFDDVDEIKAKGYDKRFLIKAGYSPLYSDLESSKMDCWNLHTYAHHGIKTSNIKICMVNDSSRMIDLLNYALDNTRLEIETICPDLYDYLKNRKLMS